MIHNGIDYPYIDRILLSEEQIEEIVKRLSQQISADYTDPSHRLVLLCILKGSVMFYSDLLKKIKRPVELEFMKASSYHQGTVTSGTVKLQLDLARDDYAQNDFIIVEDIVDSGRTLSLLKDLLLSRGANSVACCALLDKPARREVRFAADYIGRSIPDAFVVGYGLDYNERYRSLPYVGILRPEVYTK